ncbi:MAG: transglycosylase domain-containing protein [Acidimicrobiales bacterium]
MLRLVAAMAIAVVVVPPVAGAVAVATLVKAPLPVGQLPAERATLTAEPSSVFDTSGRQIGLFRGFDQTVEVKRSEVGQTVKDAFVAIEDQRFWVHDGVDFEGIARAARTNLEVGGIAQGGSTITQQFVKNVYLSGEQTIERKVEEALLATEVEKRMTKDEILFGYLTSSYYGSGAYGIGAAAEIYFDKPVAELDISEAATLAGVVQAPSRLSPYVDRDAAEARRRLVLQAMLNQEMITEAQHEREVQRRLWSIEDGDLPGGPVTTLVPRPAKGAMHVPYFVDYIEAELVERLGPDLVYNGGLRIETTLVPGLQEAAEAAVAKRLRNTEFPIEMAAATIDPSTGHIVSMVGGRDYEASQVNLATGGSTGFQPGSSFKPIVMAAAFSLGLSPESEYPAPAKWDVPGCSGNQCTVSNYDHRGRGEISLRSAMHSSVNTVFAQLVLDVTIQQTVTLARDLGLDRIDPNRAYGASLALGAAESSPLEMASAYGTFANRGIRVAPTGLLRVIDSAGNVLIDNRARPGQRVLDEVVADNVTDVLVGVIEQGTGKAANIGRPAAGKTGTAQAYRAAWFVGYTPDYATAVWMGHADRLAPLRNVNGVGNVTGGSHPAVAWAEIMNKAHEGLEEQQFPEPVEIVPISDSAAEVLSFKLREYTEAGEQRWPERLAPNCGGQPCDNRQSPLPTVPVPVPPPTVVEPSTTEFPTTDPSTSPSTTSQTESPTTVSPSTSSATTGDQ